MILVSGNIRYMTIFAGFSREEASNDSGVVDDDICGYFGDNFFGHFRDRRPALTADKEQEESRAVASKLHDAAVKFDTKHRNLQRHRAALPMMARLYCVYLFYSQLYSVAGPAKCRRIRLLQPFVGGV